MVEGAREILAGMVMVLVLSVGLVRWYSRAFSPGPDEVVEGDTLEILAGVVMKWLVSLSLSSDCYTFQLE